MIKFNWTYGFLIYVNDNNLNLRFAGDLQEVSIGFLDVQLSGINDVVVTGLYRKPTAGKVLLRVDSTHSQHTIRGVPFGQFLRLKRLCSTPDDFNREAMDMAHRFEDRGYPVKVINRAFHAAEKIPRVSLLIENKLKNVNKYSPCGENIPVFSTPFSAEFEKISSTVHKYLPILFNDPIYSEILSKGIKGGGPLSPSLFISEHLGSNWLHFRGNFKCGMKGCDYCRHIKKGKYVHSSATGKSFDITSFINCNTKFLDYVITCDLCHIQYVGRTTRWLKDRLYDHLYDIEKTNPPM